MIYIGVLVFILAILLIPILLYNKRSMIHMSCSVNSNEVIRGNGFYVVSNILSEDCRRNIVDSYLPSTSEQKKLNTDVEFDFYTSENFARRLSNLFGKELYPVNSLDMQRCWLRYYYQGMKSNYYENMHHDKKRYGEGVNQYRLVIPVYDTSDARFHIDPDISFRFTQNTGILIEAGNCMHRVEFNRGERLVLIMDFTTKKCDSIHGHYSCRGVVGYAWWMIDTVWRFASSMYYSFSNREP